MAQDPVSTPVKTQYTNHLAAALAANQAEQMILSGRLSKLQGEEKWLAEALADLPQHAGASPALSPEPNQPAPRTSTMIDRTDTAPVPLPLPRTEKTTTGTAPAKKATSAKKTVTKGAAANTSANPEEETGADKRLTKGPGVKAAKDATAEPTLGQLLSAFLAKQPGEPKKVSEIQSEFEAAHPERKTSIQTIRNALQSLVKKEELERTSQSSRGLAASPRGRENGAGARPEDVDAAWSRRLSPIASRTRGPSAGIQCCCLEHARERL